MGKADGGMKIKTVNLIADAIPGVSSKCFSLAKGDTMAYEAGLVHVTTAMGRSFVLPMAMCALEVEPPAKAAPKKADK
jgi:hypothetical protein